MRLLKTQASGFLRPTYITLLYHLGQIECDALKLKLNCRTDSVSGLLAQYCYYLLLVF